MTDRNYNASNLTNEELIHRLMAHAEYYDTFAILWEAAKRLDQVFWKGN